MQIINLLLMTFYGLKPVKLLSDYEKNFCALQMYNAANVHDITKRLEDVLLL